ncbi:MAG: serine O-acetyltransferase [Rhodospirillaceae bacterium]|jgi:serine O-acetyltransferase|nr:serine O-acetyltransferase [Rhodospirillaceae bacterium]MBT4587853.1 serine O-acetyltransferase [Rhodospirillaceae bacterium]MBT4939259.1 serine O-acetyltransferase [Rhodospirillaceae bacterium]MBT5939213.1 serine O-acetyltransferase [Rhodospirillaceae bacterium]MBT7267352.1 serine O-acetyltransferase [Rhodospirillaceae bacterium]
MTHTFFARLKEDIDSFMSRDPAARSRVEVMLCYPGYHAILFYRFSNAAWRRNWHLLGRMISNFGRFMTGIEIHPGAKIGRRFFIDHGMGVVVGETSEVGDDVTLYQGVTLGGTSLEKGKRHPTLGDGVIVGSGAQVLGPLNVGDAARIGANAVVLQDVPQGATMVGIPAKIVMGRDKTLDDEFIAYGTPADGLPDPVARSFESLRNQLNTLGERIIQLEQELEVKKADEDENTSSNSGASTGT